MNLLDYSGTLKIADRVREMSREGVEIINFAAGTLDDTPSVVKEATKRAIDDGLGSSLTDVPGLFELRETISEQLASEGITGGCGTGIYCPDADVTRAQMAVFLVKTFNLP